jgi:hypothetical protein
VGFCEGQRLRNPRCRQHYTSSRHGSEACVNTDQEILHNMWQEVEYRFDVAQPLEALTLNFINDKLLFIKLFQLVFQLVRILKWARTRRFIMKFLLCGI